MLTPVTRRLAAAGLAVLCAAFVAGYAHAQGAAPTGAGAQPACPGCPPGIIIICPGCPPYPYPPCQGCPIILPCPPDPLLPSPPGVPTPPPLPTPTPGPASALQYKVCRQITGRIPPALEQMAVAEPWKFRGYGELRNPNVPYHPMYNTYRVWLSLQNMNVPYSRCNPVVWKSGCP
jgi:hypothetical protein